MARRLTQRRIIKSAKLPTQGDPGVLIGGARYAIGSKNRRFGSLWVVRDGLVPKLDAATLVDQISQLVARIHYEAIKSGRKSFDGAAQKPLSNTTIYNSYSKDDDGKEKFGTMRTGQKNRASQFRGFKTGRFLADLTRFKLRVRAIKKTINGDVGLRAEARVGWPTTRPGGGPKTARGVPGAPVVGDAHDHVDFIKQEAKRGNKYLFVSGRVQAAVSERLQQLATEMVEGTFQPPNLGAVKASDADAGGRSDGTT